MCWEDEGEERDSREFGVLTRGNLSTRDLLIGNKRFLSAAKEMRCFYGVHFIAPRNLSSLSASSTGAFLTGIPR